MTEETHNFQEDMKCIVKNFLKFPRYFDLISIFPCEGKNTHNFGRFIVIQRLTEQLTKSRMHFAEVLRMAQETKRVLVLPNCQNGYIGNSKYFRLPLCLYFDIEKIGNAVDWVTEEFFLKRASEFYLKGRTPSFRAVYFIGEPLCNPVGNQWEAPTVLLKILSMLMFWCFFFFPVIRGRFSRLNCQRVFGNLQGISQCLFSIIRILCAPKSAILPFL